MYRILLVEDSETIQFVVSNMLKHLGMDVTAAGNGIEAIHFLTDREYDLVLMDVQMPKLNGFDTTRLIRSNNSSVKNHEVPIIAMTGNSKPSDREQCFVSGMDDYVCKPITPINLTAIINKWLLGPSQINIEIPVFNQSNLLERVSGDLEIAQCVINAFLLEIPKKITELRDALQNENAVICELCAHTIRGACANVGADTLSSLAADLELSAHYGNIHDIEKRLPELDALVSELKPELMKFTI